MKIRVHLRVNRVVEEKIFAVAGEERFHRLAVVASDGDALGVGKIGRHGGHTDRIPRGVRDEGAGQEQQTADDGATDRFW